ncbi:RNA-binding protein, partial [bacterium]|nr:RNA-binding protein [bacterium]
PRYPGYGRHYPGDGCPPGAHGRDDHRRGGHDDRGRGRGDHDDHRRGRR